MSRPYAFPRGKGAPSAAEMFRLKQLDKQKGAATAATQAVATPPSQPTFVPPSAPPSLALTVDDPLSLSGTELSIPAASASGGYIAMVGDLSGSGTAPVVAKIQGQAVATTTPDSGDVLTWNGAAWEAADPVTPSTDSSFNSPAYTTSQTLSAAVLSSAFDTTTASLTATLPAASGYTGGDLTIAKVDSSGHTLDFATTGGDNLRGGIGPITSRWGIWTVRKLDSTSWITIDRQGS